MPAIVPILVGAAEAAGGFSAIGGTLLGSTLLADVVGGATMIGGAMSVIGAVTGNSSLAKIGGIVGGVGAGALGVGELTGALTGATQAAAPITDLSTASSSATNTAAMTGTAAGANADVAANGAINSIGPAANAVNATSSVNGLAPAQALDQSINPMVGNQPAVGSFMQATPGAAPGQAATNAQSLGAPFATSNPGMPGSGPLDAFNNPVGALNGPANGPGPSGSMLGRVGDWFSGLSPTDKLAALKEGSGILGGVMSYVAPSPLDRARINQLNAQQDYLHWQQAQLAAHNAALGSLTPGAPPPGQAVGAGAASAPSAPRLMLNQPGPAAPQLAPMNALNVNAQPGILQTNLPQGA